MGGVLSELGAATIAALLPPKPGRRMRCGADRPSVPMGSLDQP